MERNLRAALEAIEDAIEEAPRLTRDDLEYRLDNAARDAENIVAELGDLESEVAATWVAERLESIQANVRLLQGDLHDLYNEV